MILVCSLDVQFQNVNKTTGISMIWVSSCMQMLNSKMSKIGIRWSGTKKCSQRYEIDHFCLGIFAGIQPSEFSRDPVGESSILFIQYPIYR